MFASVCFGVLPVGVSAQETTTYTYDELGRMISSAISGGSNNGTTTGTCFDAAGNRTQYGVANSGTASCYSGTPVPTPSPTPTPTPTPNQSPVAVNDSASGTKCDTYVVNLVANDYDPDNNVPLSLVSITRITGASSTAALYDSTSVQVTTTNVTGTALYQYVVRDSLGATATGQLSFRNTGGICGT
jgi:YD repeat-containing protein